jgi:hypothetical protein
MDTEKFKKILKEYKYLYREDNGKIIINHYEGIDLFNIASIPKGIIFVNDGYVNLNNISLIPEGTIFSNSGSLFAQSVREIGENVEFNNTDLFLRSINKLSKGVKFNNSGLILSKSQMMISLNIDGIKIQRILNCLVDQLYK